MSGEFSGLLKDKRDLARMTIAFEAAVAGSIVARPPRHATGSAIKERFEIATTIFKFLRGDLKWSTPKIADHLLEYLVAELDKKPWKPNERTVWMPGDLRRARRPVELVVGVGAMDLADLLRKLDGALGGEAAPAPAHPAQEPMAKAHERLTACLKALGTAEPGAAGLPEGLSGELKTIAGMLLSLAGGAPPASPTTGSDTTMKIQADVNKVQLAKYLQEQLGAAVAEGSPANTARLANLREVVKVAKASFEDTEATSAKLSVEEAFKGSGAPWGSAMDLTVTKDQSTTETAPGGNEGESGDANFAGNAGEVLGKQITALVNQLTAGNTEVAKGDTSGDFEWPGDLAVAKVDEKGRIQKRAPNPEGWGADPRWDGKLGLTDHGDPESGGEPLPGSRTQGCQPPHARPQAARAPHGRGTPCCAAGASRRAR